MSFQFLFFFLKSEVQFFSVLNVYEMGISPGQPGLRHFCAFLGLFPYSSDRGQNLPCLFSLPQDVLPFYTHHHQHHHHHQCSLSSFFIPVSSLTPFYFCYNFGTGFSIKIKPLCNSPSVFQVVFPLALLPLYSLKPQGLEYQLCSLCCLFQSIIPSFFLFVSLKSLLL